MSLAPSLSDLPELLRKRLISGIAEYQAGRYWHAHEAWEEPWLEADGDAKLLLQALIQLTAACHKGLAMHHAGGMARLFGNASEKLDRIVSVHGSAVWGLDLASLRAGAALARKRAEDWADGGPPLTRDAVPALVLAGPA